ncbi:hypothetical protein HK105_201369 [Polyrhizophydium stewartii]|uniref:C2H2-type domain-containing protein n=1 Tax=Polyrhizophydium stewartii TaxID=2732419 RepID=A0ABR4NI15_9FUNG|nr:hypothetical protein HK105_006517 [Polyrhizophydium stewartii]
MSFFRKQNLKAHMCVHSEIRAFACPKCPASFRRRQELQRHVRTVHAEPEMRRPFACPGCGTAFGRHDALKRHILANGGTVGPDAVTPWACSAPKTRQRSANPNPRLQVDRAAVKSDSVNS